MKKAVILIILGLANSLMAFAQNTPVGGTIYFMDGTSKKFTNVLQYTINTDRYGEGGNSYKEVLVYYENTNRTIPFNKLKEITFKQMYGFMTSFSLLTVSGIKIEDQAHNITWYLKTYDKLSEEYKTLKYCVMDQKNDFQVIKKIVFNN